MGMTAVAEEKTDQPYELAASFLRAVVVMACTQPRFYGRIGYALDPECIADGATKLALRAAHAINADLGHGPASSLVLIQRLHNWKTEGKVAVEHISAVVDLFDDAEDAGLPDEESAVNELAPMLRRRLRRDATLAAMEAYKAQGDLGQVVALEEQAQRIGVVDTSIGVVVGDASFEDIRHLRTLQRLRTGVPELDAGLNGGLQRAGLGCVCGGAGDGKSMFLSHVGGVAAFDGHVVGAVSLELPRAIWNARVIASMTGIPIDALLSDESVEERAKRELRARSGVGCIVVQQMPPQGTTVADVIQWVENAEDHIGRRMDVLIIDYVDKMVAPARGGKEMGTYDTGKVVMEGLRGFAEERGIWCWTASQSQGRQKKRKLLDLGDTAESMNKPRVADLWVTLNVTDEQDEISFFIAKHRTARARFTVGPLPTEFEVGRIAPVGGDLNG